MPLVVPYITVALLVQKFGGTSVASPDRIRAVADQVARRVRLGDSIALVVSAMGKETDDLLYVANQVSRSKPGREMDMLITAGERKAIALVCMALNDLGIKAESFTGSQAGFLTDDNHRNAKILEINPHRISEAIAEGVVPVVAGSQGVSPDKNITFLGRGGSDTTAVGLAMALDADACELFTDVSGVFSADPRLVPNAQKLSEISFDELLELTAAGCPKPALRSVELAHLWGVPLHIRSAFTWEAGTTVTGSEYPPATKQEGTNIMERSSITAVTHDADMTKHTVSDVSDVPGHSAKLFGTLSDAGISVDMIVQNVSPDGKTDITFTVATEESSKVSEALSKDLLAELGATSVATSDGVAKVTIVGAAMKSNPGVAAEMFDILGRNDINIHMISTSPVRVSCVIDEDCAEKAVVKLHAGFGLG